MSQSNTTQQTISLTGIVDQTQFDKRLDQVLADLFPEYSRSKLKEWILAGFVSIDGEVVTVARQKMRGDEQIDIHAEIAVQVQNTPQAIDLDIVFEDEHVLVINKPAGLVVHPGAGNADGTVLNALLAHYPAIETIPRAGIVHRLDKDTSGVMVAAASELGMNSLSKQFYDRTTSREYVAIVWGDVEQDEGTIEGHIGRSLKDRLQMAVFPDGSEGKHAVTHYKVLQRFGYVTVVSCKLETGRTHQIRAHMRFLGHPLFNDERYGGDKILKGTSFSKYRQFIMNCFKACPRHALHAKTLGFEHPKSGEQMRFDTVIPEDMMEVIRKFENYTKSGPIFSEKA